MYLGSQILLRSAYTQLCFVSDGNLTSKCGFIIGERKDGESNPDIIPQLLLADEDLDLRIKHKVNSTFKSRSSDFLLHPAVDAGENYIGHFAPPSGVQLLALSAQTQLNVPTT